ncbi:hypothetical protein PIROE2DRAFT_65092 [Piromyces sp. E2]|nr:hypothetical protein PIROE2DRAFT_65092 [Piromyces sp. E2]|eukprot:OUM57279.1 hypothetical protein PIROE2DRAFT_65092 [Piromyces sp. E2]
MSYKLLKMDIVKQNPSNYVPLVKENTTKTILVKNKDLSIRFEGTYRLKFSLYEMKQNKTIFRTSTISDVFTVYSPKAFPGFKESSALAKAFAEQGVKIRIKKDVNVPRTRYSKYSNDIWLNDNGEILSKEGFLLKKKLLSDSPSESDKSESFSGKESHHCSPLIDSKNSSRKVPIKQESSFIPVNIKTESYNVNYNEPMNGSYDQSNSAKYEMNKGNSNNTFISEKPDSCINVNNKKDYSNVYQFDSYQRNNTIQKSKQSNEYIYNQNISSVNNNSINNNDNNNNNNNNINTTTTTTTTTTNNNDVEMKSSGFENNCEYYRYNLNEKNIKSTSFTNTENKSRSGRSYNNDDPNYFDGYKEKAYGNTYSISPLNNEEKMSNIPRSNTNRNIQKNIPLSIPDGDFSRNIPYCNENINNIPNFRNEPSENNLNIPSTKGSSFVENNQNHYPSPIENTIIRDTMKISNIYNHYDNNQYGGYRMNNGGYPNSNKPSNKRNFDEYEQNESDYRYINGLPDNKPGNNGYRSPNSKRGNNDYHSPDSKPGNNGYRSPDSKSGNNGYRSPDSKTNSEDFNQSLPIKQSSMKNNITNHYSPTFSSSRSVPDINNHDYLRNSYVQKDDRYSPNDHRNNSYYHDSNNGGNNKEQINGNYRNPDGSLHNEAGRCLSSNTREYYKPRQDNDYYYNNSNPKIREGVPYYNGNYSEPPSLFNGYDYKQPPPSTFSHHKELPEPIPLYKDNFYLKRGEELSSLKPIKSNGYDEMVRRREDMPQRSNSYNDISQSVNERDIQLRADSYDDRYKRRRINPTDKDYFEKNITMEQGSNGRYEKYQNLTPSYSNKGSVSSSNAISLQITDNTPMGYGDERFANSRSSNNSDNGYQIIPDLAISERESRYQSRSKLDINKFCCSPRSMEISSSNDGNNRSYSNNQSLTLPNKHNYSYNNNSNNNQSLPNNCYSEKDNKYKNGGEFNYNYNNHYDRNGDNYQRECFVKKESHTPFKNNIRDIINQENVSNDYSTPNYPSMKMNIDNELKPHDRYPKNSSNFDMKISHIVIENSV